MLKSTMLRGTRPVFLAVGLLAAGGVIALAPHSFAEDARAVPAPVMDEPATGSSETAVLAGGCFWGVQGVFQHVRGVSNAVSGYAGGAAGTATYDEVSTGTTGHAESVKVTFDPHKISYGKILQIYFSAIHDPTELNRQGPDSGTQYRSAIFPTSAEQARVAKAYTAQLDAAHVYDAVVVTTIEPDRAFYPAEQHHQDFLARNPRYPYIAINDMPKVEALKRMYPALYRPEPVLVASAPSAN
ncbi:peptide-methionine (S)-S-oxide reductase MsrA [Lichenihabitans psoromatis]|uniref:peptide-methionine (S)-S-oxide reductase MsrA n=1 Tax=Lichenihabitans psoromatis TaxID=2528642 RepID=UPI0010385AE1|nr:peptide-methionine (S)-S-oxide reductase MsrA [Lichenihabitans psoromatis]